MSEWIEVATETEFETTDRKLLNLGGRNQIGLFKRPDGYFAISAWCSHQRANMVYGEITDHELECPLHGARFDLRTGQHLCLPAVRPVDRFDVKVDSGKIFLKV